MCSQTTVVIGGSNECVQGPALPGTTCASGEGEAAQAGTAAGGAETADWGLFGTIRSSCGGRCGGWGWRSCWQGCSSSVTLVRFYIRHICQNPFWFLMNFSSSLLPHNSGLSIGKPARTNIAPFQKAFDPLLRFLTWRLLKTFEDFWLPLCNCVMIYLVITWACFRIAWNRLGFDDWQRCRILQKMMESK